MKVFVTGPVSYETNGLLIALRCFGYTNTSNLSDESPTKEDVLVATYSSLPLLGWAGNLNKLKEMKDKFNCRIIILVPQTYEFFVGNYLHGCHIISSNGSIGDICNKIHSILKKSNGNNLNHFLSEKISIQDVNLLISNSSIGGMRKISRVRNSCIKTIYQQRMNVLRKLGFNSTLKWLVFSSSNTIRNDLKYML